MSRGYADRWHDPAEPSWVAEPTAEWQPQFPGQRYPGDDGVNRQPPAARGRASAVGRAEVPPLAPTRPDGTYVGRSWDEQPDGRPGRQELPEPRRPGGLSGARPYARSAAAERPEQSRQDRRRSPQGDPDRRRDGVTWSEFGSQGVGSGASPRRDPDRYADRRDQHDPDRYDRREPDRREPDRHGQRPRRSDPTDRDQFRRSKPVSSAGRPDAGWPDAGRVPEPDDDARRSPATRRPVEGAVRGPSADNPQRLRYQWSSHPGQPAHDDAPVVDGYRTEFGVGDPDGAPYPDGYVDEPVRPTLDERSRPDWSPERGRAEPPPDQQAKAAPARGDLPWPPPGPLRPSSGRDHREYQRPEAPEQGADRSRRATGGPETPGPQRSVDRPAAQLPGTERPVSPAPDGPSRRHLSVVPDRPVSPAAGRARPVSPAPRRLQPDEGAAPQRWSAAPASDRERTDTHSSGPDRPATARPDEGRTGQHRGRPAAAVDRTPAGDTVRPAPLHQHEVRSAPLQEHQVRPAPLHDQPIVATPPPAAATRPVSAPPDHRPVSAPPEPTTPARPTSESPPGWFGAPAPVPGNPPRQPEPAASKPGSSTTSTDEIPLSAPGQPVSGGAPPAWASSDATPTGPAVVPVSAPPAATPSVPVYGPPVPAPLSPPGAASPADPALIDPLSAGPVSAPPLPVLPVSAPPADATAPEAPVSGPPDDGVQVPEPAEDPEPVPEAPADPEQVLANYRWRLDPATLRELVDDPEELRSVRQQLTDKLATALDNRSRARLLSLRAVASRVLDDLDDALADGRMALTYAEATGELRRTALAQARLAHVLHWRGEFAEADRLFAEANSVELPDRLRAALHEHAARCCYDQGRLIEACHHFERALDLRGEGDAELLDRVRTGLDAIADRAAETGFGPYPRSWDAVLERDRSPQPARDGGQGLWGYADAEGDMVVPARYAEAQPFRDGLAWVRGPQTDRWSLIDLAGETVIEPAFLAARPFSDGLAWVVRDESGWMAVDTAGKVAVPPGFAEVRPFRKGVATVRREGWGAVDRTGRIVVPTQYHGFHTTLADGRYIDGFTDEGLAVVDLAGRKGVVDRAGQVIVAPSHPALLIHPVAFLATNSAGNWGALDRRGAGLIDPMFHHPDAVVTEIEGLLTDANPVL
ncbi:WG repeat-containing protein [Micromonospora sp. LOL_024]|uniref:WG repeat-containing protein n=1 Tax=Micromonospora sp. LOL_024 TaxID=3345412 RepID=UPI003A857C63